jgi:hypothetical protein
MPGGYIGVLLRLMKADQRQDVPWRFDVSVVTVPPRLATTFVVRRARRDEDDNTHVKIAARQHESGATPARSVVRRRGWAAANR